MLGGKENKVKTKYEGLPSESWRLRNNQKRKERKRISALQTAEMEVDKRETTINQSINIEQSMSLLASSALPFFYGHHLCWTLLANLEPRHVYSGQIAF
jgi:hypothetical protein